jgi:hypothetical protein
LAASVGPSRLDEPEEPGPSGPAIIDMIGMSKLLNIMSLPHCTDLTRVSL